MSRPGRAPLHSPADPFSAEMARANDPLRAFERRLDRWIERFGLNWETGEDAGWDLALAGATLVLVGLPWLALRLLAWTARVIAGGARALAARFR